MPRRTIAIIILSLFCFSIYPALAVETTTFDRVYQARLKKEITLKDEVIIKAKLAFAPYLMTAGSKFLPQPGELMVNKGESMTGFYKDVRKVFPELTQDEKDLLKSFSPDLKVIIEAMEKEKKEKK